MRKLLNTLYIISDDLYLSLENNNVTVTRQKEVVSRVPMQTLESIVIFNRKGISIPLYGSLRPEQDPNQMSVSDSCPSQKKVILKEKGKNKSLSLFVSVPARGVRKKTNKGLIVGDLFRVFLSPRGGVRKKRQGIV